MMEISTLYKSDLCLSAELYIKHLLVHTNQTISVNSLFTQISQSQILLPLSYLPQVKQLVKIYTLKRENSLLRLLLLSDKHCMWLF